MTANEWKSFEKWWYASTLRCICTSVAIVCCGVGIIVWLGVCAPLSHGERGWEWESIMPVIYAVLASFSPLLVYAPNSAVLAARKRRQARRRRAHEAALLEAQLTDPDTGSWITVPETP